MFDQILQRCLAKAPDDRFPSMASLVDTLDAAEQAMLRASSSTVMALTSPRRVATNPTTITHASGQALAPAVRRRLWPLVATVVFTTGAIVSAVMVRSHGHAAAIAALSTTTSVGLVPADAAVTVVPVDAAGVDAPELAVTPVDAAAPPDAAAKLHRLVRPAARVHDEPALRPHVDAEVDAGVNRAD
jgi:hypothetical protein